MRVWTDEQKAKAAATRAATKRNKEEREAKKIARQGSVPKNEESTMTETLDAISKVPIAPLLSKNGFDWNRAPIEEIMGRLADMKREYDRCTQIVLARQSITRPKWTCWTQLHKDLVPKSVAALCRKTGEDGKWASRDDGVFKIVDGIRIPDPVFCCSALCHELFLKNRPMAALSRH